MKGHLPTLQPFIIEKPEESMTGISRIELTLDMRMCC